MTQRLGLGASRRDVFLGLVASVIAAASGLALAAPGEAAQCRLTGRRCRRPADCCSRRCARGRRRRKCKPGPRGRACRQTRRRRTCQPGVTGRSCRSAKDCQSRTCACGNPASSRICWAPTWVQNFDRNLNGWFDRLLQPGGLTGDLQPARSTIQRRPANNIPIPPASGAFVGQVFGPVNAVDFNTVATLTNWGGYKQTIPAGGYTVSLDIYIDPVLPPDPNARFAYVVTASNPDNCLPTGTIIFRAGNQLDQPDVYCISINESDVTGGPGDSSDVLDLARDPALAGWFSFTVEFFANTPTNQVIARGTVRDAEAGASQTREFIVPGGYGGNNFAWFPFIQGYDAVYIDNAVRTSGGVTP